MSSWTKTRTCWWTSSRSTKTTTWSITWVRWSAWTNTKSLPSSKSDWTSFTSSSRPVFILKARISALSSCASKMIKFWRSIRINPSCSKSGNWVGKLSSKNPCISQYATGTWLSTPSCSKKITMCRRLTLCCYFLTKSPKSTNSNFQRVWSRIKLKRALFTIKTWNF